ncbi:MAG: ABC transporter ATP-binding protein [Rhizobiaceae bacterium]|nr:MAG: ABC transporter ATP-binding protein [Rhizobiaceae bacterium]CAG1014240.1 sulfonate transport system ATP-binding protein [Rhizobiaceae bacterium]
MSDESLLSLAGVRRAFDGGRIVALDGVDLAIGSGESVALVGRSGSGKSCLVAIATGLDKPDAGAVYWRGRKISSRREWAALRRQSIGIVFQEFHLLPTLTAQQNVELALMGGRADQAEQRRAAAAALDRVGLAGRRDNLPSEMSGGERQRVAIARALVRDPLILFADEPTGNLDSVNAEKVAALLLDLQRERGVSLVLVTHDTELAERCHRIVRLSDGHVVEDRRMGENVT